MNIKIIKGDLISLGKSGEFDIIAQGCNCQNIWGAGLALQMKREFPDALTIDKEYRDTFKDPIQMMGTWSSHFEFISVNPNKWLQILNLYTQMWPGIPSPGCAIPFDYDAFRVICKKLNYHFKGKSIGLPYVGCGLAGAEKFMVRGIIEHYLTDMNVTIIDYEDKKIPQRSIFESGLGEIINARARAYKSSEGARRSNSVERNVSGNYEARYRTHFPSKGKPGYFPDLG